MGSLDTVQQEQLRAIGSYLNQIRQEQARSLEEISAKTYIPLRLLKAIESGQERPLPEPVFIQGFIRRYADALGLDGIDLSQRFPIHITPLPVMTAVSGNREKLKEPTHRNNISPTEDAYQASSGLKSNRFPYIAGAVLLAIGGIALAVVWGLSSRHPSSPQSPVVLPKQPALPQSSPRASVSPKVSPSIAPKTTVVSPSASPAPAASKAELTPASPRPTASSTTASPTATSPATTRSPSSSADRNAPVRVELSLTDEAWVQVIVDGQVETEAVLPKGTRQSWSGKQEITIVSGNAGAVSVTQNGGSSQKMGALGDVSEMTFKSKP